MLGSQLLIGAAMIGVSVVIHIGGIIVAVPYLKSRALGLASRQAYFSAVRIFGVAVLGIFFLHTVEIWLWALLYVGLKQFEDLERAVYFSTVTFTTLGYGDITLQKDWQLLSSLEAVNGIILFGVSTAFLFAVLQRLFEAAGIIERK